MKAVRLSMSNRDVYRATVMRMVTEGRHTLGEAAGKIGLSYRQAKRIYRRYREEGDTGGDSPQCGQALASRDQ